jgi:hypothetical protein
LLPINDTDQLFASVDFDRSEARMGAEVNGSLSVRLDFVRQHERCRSNLAPPTVHQPKGEILHCPPPLFPRGMGHDSTAWMGAIDADQIAGRASRRLDGVEVVGADSGDHLVVMATQDEEDRNFGAPIVMREIGVHQMDITGPGLNGANGRE